MMVKLLPLGVKVLKIVHLVSVIAWVGAAIVMNAIRHLVVVDNGAGMRWMAEFLEAVDMRILVPGAVLCLFTGLLYSVLTHWGFFKHRWIAVKWVLTIAMMALGTFFMGPLIKAIVTIGRALAQAAPQAHDLSGAYWHNVALSARWGLLQLCLLAFTIVISVLKPWKGPRKGADAKTTKGK